MKIIQTKYLPPKNYDAINILGLLFVHPNVKLTKEIINHERIHTRLPMAGRAYLNLSFEREAYQNMNNLNYLSHRCPFAWTQYLRRK